MKVRDIIDQQLSEAFDDEDRQDAHSDAHSDGLDNFMDDMIDEEYYSVYDILERADVEESKWMALLKYLPDGVDEELIFVEKEQARAFLSMAFKNPKEAFMKYANTPNAIKQDHQEEWSERYEDNEEYSDDPSRYNNVSRY